MDKMPEPHYNPKCVTHFTGCDCQEAKLAQLTQGLEAVRKQKDEAEMLAQLFEEGYAEWEYKCLQAEKERDEVREHRDELKRGNWEVETSQALEISKLKRERDALSTQIAGLQEQVVARTAERNKLAAERDRLQAQLAKAKDGLEKLKDGPGNKMEGWKATWVHDYARKVLADIQAQGDFKQPQGKEKEDG